MKIYKIYQTVNNDYDTYSDAVVCAEDEQSAKAINPGGFCELGEDLKWYFVYHDGRKSMKGDDSWADYKDIKVQYLGEADSKIPKGVITASYHAG